MHTYVQYICTSKHTHTKVRSRGCRPYNLCGPLRNYKLGNCGQVTWLSVNKDCQDEKLWLNMLLRVHITVVTLNRNGVACLYGYYINESTVYQ